MLQFLITLQILWSLQVLYLAHKRFGGKFDYLSNPDVQVNKKYEAFTRNDYQNWSKTEFTLVGIFLVPFRLVMMLGYLVIALTLTKLLFIIKGIKDYNRLSKPVYYYCRTIVSTWAKLFMFLFGIQYKEVLKEIDDSKYTKVQRANIQHINESIIACNHVCFFDFFPFFAYYDACTIAKSMVKGIPMISLGAQIAQVIFVERSNKNSRKDAMQKLRNRIELNKQGITPSQILIFPEATVSNGKYLLQFKRGAFVNELPITICACKYESRFDPSMNLVGFLDGIIGLLFQFRMKMVMYRIKHAYEPKQGTTVDEFAEEIRTIMANEIGFKKSHNKYPDNDEFEEMYME